MKMRFSQNAGRAFGIGLFISYLMSLPSVGQPPTTLPTSPVVVSPPKGGSSPRAETTRMLVWGIPQETCTAYGGRYDSKSGFSEWKTSLVLDSKSESKIAGTLISGTRKLQFGSELDDKSALRSLLITSGDMIFSITISPTNEKQVEIKIGKASSETVYAYRYLDKKIEVIKGTPENVGAVMAKWDAFLLFPLLSYKLGEMGVRGNVYPAALPIHQVALSVAKKKLVRVYKMRDRDTDNPHIPDGEDEGSITPVGSSRPGGCTGQRPGSVAQECWGECGPFWFGQCVCWEQVCGDCCCWAFCRDHDAACECDELVYCYVVGPFEFVTRRYVCIPCDNPGNFPPCRSQCPSGQFYCSHSGRCQTNGSTCEPNCDPGMVYCAKLGLCVGKPQCDLHDTCPPGYIRIFEKCYKKENTQ